MTSFVASSGLTSGLIVSSGQSGIVLAGGTASEITVRAGGQIDISAGGQDRGTILAGAEMVSSGAAAVGTSVGSGAVQQVLTSGAASFTLVSSGGTQTVMGNANFTTLSAGGIQSVASGGNAAATTVLSGGTQAVFAGGHTALTTVAAFGGYEYISSGGIANNTMLNSAAQEFVFAGGSAVSTTMAAGGIDSEIVFSGGTASSTNLGAGNFEYVLSGGTAIGSLVGAASTEYVAGSASGTQLSSGGQQIVSSGGRANATTVLGGGVQEILAGAQVTNTLLSAGGAIDISYLLFSSGGSATLSAGMLTVHEGAVFYTQSLGGNYTTEYFQTASDGDGGTVVTAMPDAVSGTPCYCRGTRILTDAGEVAVEALQIGDRLITYSGQVRPLIWIGRRSYAGAYVPGNHEVLPICIRAGALADDVPKRDLFVSPLHALYLENMLVPAASLINGDSIVQRDTSEQVDYFHLELDTHDVIFAEGAPAESFVDDDSRPMFQNAVEYRRLYPDAADRPARYCAPRLEGGPLLEDIRAHLTARAHAAHRPPDHETTTIALQGRLDLVERARICGWARNAAEPGRPVRLIVFDNAIAIGEVLAKGERPDLTAAGYGHHAFEFFIPGGLSPSLRHCIEVRCAQTRQMLPNAPQILEPCAAIFAIAPDPEPPGSKPNDRWHGRVDVVTRERIAGWAQDGLQPKVPVDLQILDNGTLIAQTLANRYRPDLVAAGIGSGWHSFDLRLPGGLCARSRHVIEVRRAQDGGLLGAPAVIEAADRFDAGLEQTVAQAVDAVAGRREQERVLSFMLTQADRLLQQRADHEGLRDIRHRRGARTRAPRRALVVDQRVPDPRRDGGSRAILSHMRALQRLDYSVSFVAADEIAAPGAAGLPDGILHCRAPFYASVEEVLRRQAGCFDLVYLHRVDIAARYLALARAHVPRARILYSIADLHHLRLARQAAIEGRPELLAESRRLRLAECTAAWSADAVISHSPAEVAILRAAVPEAQVHHVPWDVTPALSPVPFAERAGIAWVGYHAHAPNLDAARFLLQAVMPLVWQMDAGITCRVVGSEIPQTIRRLQRPGVIVVGQVDDLHRDVFDHVRLSVAPLRYGAGIKGKVLDSFAAGVPCVMTDIAAEGLPLSPALRAWVGEDAPGLAALICRLHTHAAEYETASAAGQALVATHFSADAVTAALQAAIEGRCTAAPGKTTMLTATA